MSSLAKGIIPYLLADSKPLGKEVILILMLLVEASCYEPQCVTSGLPNHCFVRHFIIMRIFHKNTPLPRPCGLVARISSLLLLNQHSLVGIRPVKMGLGKISLGRFIKGSIRPRQTGEESSNWRKEQAQKLKGNGIDGCRQLGVKRESQWKRCES